MAYVTLSIPNDVKKKMDEHSSIKWSEIFRNMIIKKIEEIRKVEALKKRGAL